MLYLCRDRKMLVSNNRDVQVEVYSTFMMHFTLL